MYSSHFNSYMRSFMFQRYPI